VYDSATATYEPECNQLISVEGVATFGSAASTGCSDCTGKIDFDASTAVDISPSAPAGQGCDVAVLDAAGRNMGQALLLSQANGGWGDFLSIGLIDATTMGNEGLDLLAGGGATAADLDVGLADQGRVFTHAGYSDMQTGNLADLASIDITFAPAGSGSSWHGAWQISTDPSQNTYVGPDLNGQYSVAGIWLITFEPSE